MTGATGATGVTGSEAPAFQSLVFNAQTMNSGSSATAPHVQTLNNSGPVAIRSWTMANRGAIAAFNTIFNVPHEFVNSATQTLVIVHFDTERTTPSVVTGNVVIQLQTTFTPVDGTIVPPPTTYSTTVTGVTSTSSANAFNHYDAVFMLSETIAPEDFALLSVSRTHTSSDDTYPDDVFLTSVEFRYTTT